ncbi:MAG: TRAP transporter substrate-binding protein DctP [Zhengella sp.]|uniref:TRAP transporter substrate-binding protein DctP n=1 Tax=Zhengella sp. TaxID=2282762 RepID=UPI001D6495B7|nr:TRAP transporter substrate-binding protein DctP [Notoacmeibacter sp.]MCC0026829.1 TRAP transporter substrate-binding protein DctP [Brucellaceae bacterium]
MSEYRIVFHHDGSNLDPFYDRFVTEWAQRIEEQSDGRIEVELFHSGQLVRASQILDGVEIGVIDAGIVALDSLVDERFSLFELPFVASADASGARTAWEIIQSDLDGILGNVRILAAFIRGATTLASNEVLAAPDDLAGLKVRSSGTVTGDFLDLIGASALPLAYGELYPAMQTGVIDAMALGSDRVDFLQSGLGDVITQALVFDDQTGFTNQLHGLVIDADLYNSLPADLQQVIDDNSGPELSAMAGAVLDAIAAEYVADMEQAGVNVIRASEPQMEAWKAAAQPVIDGIVQNLETVGLDAQALMTDLQVAQVNEIFLVLRSDLGVDSVDELAGATFAVQAGSAAEAEVTETLNARGIGFQLISFSDPGEVTQAFLQGRSDVFATMDPVAASAVINTGGMDVFRLSADTGETFPPPLGNFHFSGPLQDGQASFNAFDGITLVVLLRDRNAVEDFLDAQGAAADGVIVAGTLQQAIDIVGLGQADMFATTQLSEQAASLAQNGDTVALVYDGDAPSGQEPDLVVADLVLDAVVWHPGDVIGAGWSVVNQGDASAGDSRSSLFLSSNQTISTVDRVLLADAGTGILDPAEARAADVPNAFTVPSDLSPGTYFAGVIADVDQAVAESDESNNLSGVVRITVERNSTGGDPIGPDNSPYVYITAFEDQPFNATMVQLMHLAGDDRTTPKYTVAEQLIEGEGSHVFTLLDHVEIDRSDPNAYRDFTAFIGGIAAVIVPNYDGIDDMIEALRGNHGNVNVFTIDRNFQFHEFAAADAGEFDFDSWQPPLELIGQDVDQGTASDDTRDGGPSDDYFLASPGNDTIDGAGGTDSIVYGGVRADYVQDLQADGSILVDKPDGTTDTLTAIERIDLLDGDYVYDIGSDNLGFGYRIYQASFGRTPDEGGVRFWIGVLDTLDSWGYTDYAKQQYVASEFIGSDEFQGLYGANPTNFEYIDAMYQNVLFRLPDQEGYDFWVGGMEAGLTREDILIAFTQSQENISNNIANLDDGVWVL